MKFDEIYEKKSDKVKVSFEVFPPKDVEAFAQLENALCVLKDYSPVFISLTWGAGGKSNQSAKLISNIRNAGFEVMPHFTCVCSSKNFVEEHINDLEKYGIDKILALRGDIPDDKSLMCHDFSYASDLVSFIKKKSNLNIAVAGYPEGHIEAPSLDFDLVNLKKKVDVGANAIFTQLFFDNTKFYEYVEKVRAMGISIPIIPGIMPIISKKQIDKMTNLARISVPKNLQAKIEKYQNSQKKKKKMGIEYAQNQCQDLISNGVNALHFYTLNKSSSVKEILCNII